MRVGPDISGHPGPVAPPPGREGLSGATRSVRSAGKGTGEGRQPMPRQRQTMRRALAFDTFQQVLAEIAEVRKAHRTTGNWTLAQVCKHLADSVNGSIDGFDLRQHRIKRTLFKRPLLWYTFRWGIPREYTVDPALTPPREIDIEAALVELTPSIQRYTAPHRPPSDERLLAPLGQTVHLPALCLALRAPPRKRAGPAAIAAADAFTRAARAPRRFQFV